MRAPVFFFIKNNEMNTQDDIRFLKRAIELSEKNIAKGGGPFGAVIVADNTILAESGNNVRIHNDPTAHAEVEAIRMACKKKKSFSLENCTIYASCEPCPMCLSAIYWAKISRIVFAASRSHAAEAGFNDAFLYEEMQQDIASRSIPTIQIQLEDTNKVFKKWADYMHKLMY
jgi:guanine deaminase